MEAAGRKAFLQAVFLWFYILVLVLALVIQSPYSRTVTRVYHSAADNWLSGRDLYTDCGGLNYLPPFAVIFAPFHLLPFRVGDCLWRSASLLTLVTAMWRLARCFPRCSEGRLYLTVSLLALLPSLGAIRNGQATILFAGLTLHGAASLARSQWWRAAACITAALLIKPVGVVMLLLAPLRYAPLLRRIPVALAAGILAPFLVADFHYVLSQYGSLLSHLQSCSAISEHRFADFNGLLRSIGVILPPAAAQAIRILAAIATLGIWITGSRGKDHPEKALLLLGLTAGYLMLFNPMTETNTYAFAAPVLAFYAALCAEAGERRPAWLLSLMTLSIAVLPLSARVFTSTFGLWWDPLMMILFGAFLLYRTFRAPVPAGRDALPS